MPTTPTKLHVVRANSLSGSQFVLKVATIALLTFSHAVLSQTLYDPSLGTLPGNQGWTFAAFGSATQMLTNNAVLLDTSPATSTQAGYSLLSQPSLNRTNGFTLLFTAQLHSEIHNNTNRAGFSLIVLATDKRGIELGFWTNVIFAQTDSPLFTHGEDAAFQTAPAFVAYALTIRATNYVLRANGTSILSGPVRDYTAFSGSLDPYETPEFLFFGDDTTSASASVSLGKVVLVTPPTIVVSDAGVVCWNGVSNQTYTVQASTNLTDWGTIGTVTSPTASFCFTNNVLLSQRFYRVTHP